MKKQFLTLGAIVAILFTSCSDDDTGNVTVNNNTGGVVAADGNLSGVFTDDLTLDPEVEYLLNGPLIMAENTTLTIPAGTTISAIRTGVGADTFIAISQGARIEANGTAENPIVLTSNETNPVAGDWGGLIVLGRAPINSVTGEATSTSEIANLPYGGTNAADNSGTISYMRIEYSGGSADGSSENNGLSLYGVGNGTTLEFIQTFEGLDDGIEFFGGTVNASNLAVTNAQDDSIDWTEGYTGTITDAYIQHGAEHDKGVEADGFNTDIGLIGDFLSSPIINNLTIIGVSDNDPETTTEAIRLRVGTEVEINNLYISNFEEAIDIDDEQTGVSATEGNLTITDATFVDVDVTLTNDTGAEFAESDIITGVGNGVATDFATWGAGWTR